MFALWIATAFLILAMLLIFGWPLVVLGPKAAMTWTREPAAKLVASAFATTIMVITLLPLANAGLHSSGSQMQMMHDGFTGLTWQA